MHRFTKILLLLSCACILSGCDDLYTSQAPTLSHFVGKSPEHIFHQALKAYEVEQYNKAISYFKAFIKLYPEDKKRALVEIKLIECYKTRGQFKDALDRIDYLLKNYPENEYYLTLVAERTQLKNKYRMDKWYAFSWMQDIKSKHHAQYNSIEKALRKLKVSDQID